MNILGFDTSTDACSVALRVGDQEWTDHRVEPRLHAQLLLPMIEGIVAMAGIALRDIDVLAYGCGPGSFTGVRIAVAAAQGLSLSCEADTVGVSTLAALAEAARLESGAEDIVASLDARMSEVYVGHYRVDADQLALQGGEQVCAPTVLADYPSSLHVGPGAERYAELVTGKLISGLLPTASALLTLAYPLAQSGLTQPPGDAHPVYLRDKVALTEAERAQA